MDELIKKSFFHGDPQATFGVTENYEPFIIPSEDKPYEKSMIKSTSPFSVRDSRLPPSPKPIIGRK